MEFLLSYTLREIPAVVLLGILQSNECSPRHAAALSYWSERNAFLYGDDIIPAKGANESNEDDLEEIAAVSINDVLSEGQEFLYR